MYTRRVIVSDSLGREKAYAEAHKQDQYRECYEQLNCGKFTFSRIIDHCNARAAFFAAWACTICHINLLPHFSRYAHKLFKSSMAERDAQTKGSQGRALFPTTQLA